MLHKRKTTGTKFKSFWKSSNHFSSSNHFTNHRTILRTIKSKCLGRDLWKRTPSKMKWHETVEGSALSPKV